MYKQIINPIDGEVRTTAILRIADMAYIPFDPANSDYQAYLKWLDGYEWQVVAPMKMEWVKTSDSNQPLPADE